MNIIHVWNNSSIVFNIDVRVFIPPRLVLFCPIFSISFLLLLSFYHFIVGCIPFFNICVRKVDPVWNINLAAKVILAQTLDYVCMRVYKLLDVYKMMTYYARAFISFVTLTHLIKYWLVSCVSVCVCVLVCADGFTVWAFSVSVTLWFSTKYK